MAVVVFASCSKERLSLSPLSAIGEDIFYSNAEEVEGAVLAIYDGLQFVPLREFALTEMRSDNTRTKSSEGDWAQFESFAVQPTNLAIGDYWSANYNVIFRANRVLENLEVVSEASLSNQFEGEALFARALSHFNLVRAFGGVPIIDKVITQVDEDYFAKSTEAQVLAVIDSDLTSAISKLPADMPFGRATQGAAQALLAKVKLTTGDYTGARTLCEAVVNSGNYGLEEEYNNVFFSEGNDEIVFAIPYLNDDANEGQDFSFEMTAGGAVSGLNYITDDFNANYDATDVERAVSIYSPNNPAEVGKFVTTSDDARLCGNDWIVLRYSDVLLMHAEAILGGNASTTNEDAIGSFNAVRERAGMPTLATDGSEAVTKTNLLAERRVELAFENHRLYDLVRFGMASEVLTDFAAAEGYTFSPTDLLLPIPQGEINVSAGLLIQNPGY